MVRIERAQPTTGSKAPTVVQGSGADTLQDSNPLDCKRKSKINLCFQSYLKKQTNINLLLYISMEYTKLFCALLLSNEWEICSYKTPIYNII